MNELSVYSYLYVQMEFKNFSGTANYRWHLATNVHEEHSVLRISFWRNLSKIFVFGKIYTSYLHKFVCHLFESSLGFVVLVPSRVSVQRVKPLGGHFACLCRGFEFYEVKKKLLLFFKKKMEILLHF